MGTGHISRQLTPTNNTAVNLCQWSAFFFVKSPFIKLSSSLISEHLTLRVK